MYQLNSQIEALYIQKRYCGEYPPMFYDEPSKSQNILSLGLNPSLVKGYEKRKELKLQEFIKSGGKERESRIEALIHYQKELKYGLNNDKEQISYFKQLSEFFDELERDGFKSFQENVYHYDLCQKRETDSKKVLKLLKDKPELSREVIRHLDFIISDLKPKIIFVFNASVAKLLKEYKSPEGDGFFEKNEMDKASGCYNRQGTPVILANQLSGGATSLVYKEMLIWNVNRIIEKL